MIDTLLDMSALRFLIVDDSAEMRLILKQVLNSLGALRFHEASDGAEALKILSSNQVDIVLTDWMMSPVDGIEFTQQVRTAPDSNFPMIPIIMISGYTEARHVAESRDAGVTEFLAKPISPIALYQRIEEVILRPRQFIRTKNYNGPDRHRHSDEVYDGQRRREEDKDRESMNDSGNDSRYGDTASISEQNASEA